MLLLRDESLMSMRDFPESLSQAMLVGIILVGGSQLKLVWHSQACGVQYLGRLRHLVVVGHSDQTVEDAPGSSKTAQHIIIITVMIMMISIMIIVIIMVILILIHINNEHNDKTIMNILLNSIIMISQLKLAARWPRPGSRWPSRAKTTGARG